jgi:hypothetical protein
MRSCLLLIGLIGAACTSGMASTIDATATYTDTLVSPGVYQYDLTLNDTGGTTIGTFWFSWIPGDNFMPVSPTDIVAPTGWQDIVTNGGSANGYAIQWTTTASSNDLASGSSLSGFTFDSTLTPIQLAGLASGSPADPIPTSFSYAGAPLVGPGVQFVATPAASTPESSTLWMMASALTLIGVTHLLGRRAQG